MDARTNGRYGYGDEARSARGRARLPKELTVFPGLQRCPLFFRSPRPITCRAGPSPCQVPRHLVLVLVLERLGGGWTYSNPTFEWHALGPARRAQRDRARKERQNANIFANLRRPFWSLALQGASRLVAIRPFAQSLLQHVPFPQQPDKSPDCCAWFASALN
jgi:hypothetical protein